MNQSRMVRRKSVEKVWACHPEPPELRSAKPEQRRTAKDLKLRELR
jgi:hypothetical protein